MTQRLVDTVAGVLARTVDRRGLLARGAVVGSALATSGLDYVLRPGSAYASVCGSGSSCASGWTAMCCTINNGVNQCPPGSFAGGWWKADGASLCGGSARYYIDCQAECTGCGCGGGAFCSQSCWNCRPHCANGSCDKRRVCHNVFRYGQCDRERSCSGPVLCRTISCTPPWQWLDCSSASATDEATRDHSASCLSGWTPIAQRYTAMGSQGSVLGASVGHEHEVTVSADSHHHHTRHAKVQHYLHGRMYWSHATGAHWLDGLLLHTYRHLGETHSPLGLPTGDAHRLEHGRAARFEHGGVYQHHAEAHGLWGRVFTVWRHHGGHSGALGWPTSSVHDVHGGGSWASFEHGGVYNGPKTPTRALTGAIDRRYADTGRYDGPLGWPTDEATELAGRLGRRATFQNGEIVQGNGQDAHALWGSVDRAWLRSGGAAGPLGVPTSERQDVTGRDGTAGSVTSFTGGTVADIAGPKGARGVWGPIDDAWQSHHGPRGRLGFPTTDVFTNDDGLDECDFQHGTITYDRSTGTITITYT